MLEYLNVKSGTRTEFIDITREVQKEIDDAGLDSGLCYLHVPHTTAGLTINEGADPSVKADILSVLANLVPHEHHYRHAEGNSDAHIKSSLMGVSLCLNVHEGKIVLGTWQSIFFTEFDGPRHRRVEIKLIKD